MKLRITQDREANATYVYFREGATHERTECLPNGVNVDYDADGNLLGVEVLELVDELVIVDLTRR
jgi:uncharacterized protein YuzE